MSIRAYSFYDRKLNRCEHCGTREQLAPIFRDDGRLYFLCRDAVDLANANEYNEMEQLGVTIVRRDEFGQEG